MKFLCDPPLFLTSRPQVISHNCCWFGEETKAPSADGSVYRDPRCRWRKSLVGRAVPASSKLPPASPPELRPSLPWNYPFLCTYKSKTLRATPAPPPKLLYKNLDGHKQYGAQHKNYQWLNPPSSGITKQSTGHVYFPNITSASVVFIILSVWSYFLK